MQRIGLGGSASRLLLPKHQQHKHVPSWRTLKASSLHTRTLQSQHSVDGVQKAVGAGHHTICSHLQDRK